MPFKKESGEGMIKELTPEYIELKEKLYEGWAKPDITIRQHTDKLLDNAHKLLNMGYIKDDIYKLLCIACEYHDMGKANNEFQERIKRNMQGEKVKFNSDKEIVHNILSFFMMPGKEYLVETEEEFLTVSLSVLLHHDYEKNVFEFIDKNKGKIDKILKKYEQEYEGIGGFRKFRRSDSNTLKKYMKKQSPNTIMVKGLLHKCDYAASGNYEIELGNDFLREYMEKLVQKWSCEWEKQNFLKDKGSGKFKQKPCLNEMQIYCRENKDNNIVVVAQTGMGKTEGSLLWLDNNKGFYILPVRTAINVMYDRIKEDILENEKFEERISLLHSNTLDKYLNDLGIDDKDALSYSERGKNLTMPITISTLDQLFDFVYKYQGYELKLATLSYSKIIIDEIQMYGPKLLAYLLYGISQIIKLGGKVAVVTATMPPFIMHELEELGLEFKYKEFNSELIRHNVKVLEERINADHIIRLFKENMESNKPNKVLVICNTVKDSQKMYESLKDEIGEEYVNLLHSKYIRKDRDEKEKNIKKCGQSNDICNEIWISTSLVEASLDIDFDYLFTELYDLNSLFQRFGRCNRKGYKSVEETNCFVYTEVNKELLKKENSDKGFIDGVIYDLSKQAVLDSDNGLCGIVTEKQKLELLKKYFSYDKVKESPFMKEYRSEIKELENLYIHEKDKRDINLRNIHNIDVFPLPVFEANRDKIIDISKQLKQKDCKDMDRRRLKAELMSFTVSVGIWEYSDFKKAYCNYKTKVNDYPYKEIEINSYESIPIMECEYDLKLGYRKINFENRKEEALIF